MKKKIQGKDVHHIPRSEAILEKSGIDADHVFPAARPSVHHRSAWPNQVSTQPSVESTASRARSSASPFSVEWLGRAIGPESRSSENGHTILLGKAKHIHLRLNLVQV